MSEYKLVSGGPTSRLLPCPFCGGDDIGNRYIETYSCDSSYDIFGCKACGAGFNNDDQSGPSLWNRRAAPAVQGEPVGYVSQDFLEGKWSLDHIAKSDEGQISRTIPVFAKPPQPAEQKPSADDSFTPVPDELFAAEFAAWWEEHGQFCRTGGGTYEQSFAFEAWRHLYPKLVKLQKVAAEQQPDVSGLVDALEGLLPFVTSDSVECRGDKCREHWCLSCWDEETVRETVKNIRTAVAKADDALAAHHSRGGE